MSELDDKLAEIRELVNQPSPTPTFERALAEIQYLRAAVIDLLSRVAAPKVDIEILQATALERIAEVAAAGERHCKEPDQVERFRWIKNRATEKAVAAPKVNELEPACPRCGGTEFTTFCGACGQCPIFLDGERGNTNEQTTKTEQAATAPDTK